MINTQGTESLLGLDNEGGNIGDTNLKVDKVLHVNLDLRKKIIDELFSAIKSECDKGGYHTNTHWKDFSSEEFIKLKSEVEKIIQLVDTEDFSKCQVLAQFLEQIGDYHNKTAGTIFGLWWLSAIFSPLYFGMGLEGGLLQYIFLSLLFTVLLTNLGSFVYKKKHKKDLGEGRNLVLKLTHKYGLDISTFEGGIKIINKVLYENNINILQLRDILNNKSN